MRFPIQNFRLVVDTSMKLEALLNDLKAKRPDLQHSLDGFKKKFNEDHDDACFAAKPTTG